MDRVTINIYIEEIDLDDAVALKKAVDELLADIPKAQASLSTMPKPRRPE